MFRRLRTSITDTKQAPGDLRAISNIIGDGDTTIEASRTVKYAITRGPPVVAAAVSSGPIVPLPIVKHNYTTSTPRKRYFEAPRARL